MSKAFTRDDAPDAAPIVRPRAPLPSGVPNYVTPRGLAALRAELRDLDAERARIDAGEQDDAERRRRLDVLATRSVDLLARIGSARLVPRAQPHDEVRFGATVALRILRAGEPDAERHLTIVGVDEAAPAEGRVAFLAPIAHAILGLRVGESAMLRTARGDEELVVLSIRYDPGRPDGRSRSTA